MTESQVMHQNEFHIDPLRLKEINDIQYCQKMENHTDNLIKEIRGVGLMKGLKMLVDNTEFMQKLMNHKMLTVKAEENVVRLFPSLIVKNEELEEAIDKIEKVCISVFLFNNVLHKIYF